MPLVESLSGVRGIYNDGLNKAVAARYAFHFLTLIKKKSSRRTVTLVIGSDTRPSYQILKKELTAVLACNIIDVGIATTPETEFAVRHFKADGGIMITASHNEPYWNGFKFLGKDGAVMRERDMQQLIKTYHTHLKKPLADIKQQAFLAKAKLKNRTITNKFAETKKQYVRFLLAPLSTREKRAIKQKKLKILLDPNGGAGISARLVLSQLGVTTKIINGKPGVFNRLVEPTTTSIFYLTNHVRDSTLDFAAAFDCDADRVEIITEKRILNGNHMLALIADTILPRSRIKRIVVNDATSQVVKDIAKKHKAAYHEVSVGESNVVTKMYKLKAPIGGEGSSSGVIVAPSRCRDGTQTLVYLLTIIATTGKRLEELVKNLPTYYNLKEKVTIPTKVFDKKIIAILKHYRKKGFSVKHTTRAGSIKATKKNQYVFFRMSKTEADALRIIVDAPSPKEANALKREALSLLRSNGKR